VKTYLQFHSPSSRSAYNKRSRSFLAQNANLKGFTKCALLANLKSKIRTTFNPVPPHSSLLIDFYFSAPPLPPPFSLSLYCSLEWSESCLFHPIESKSFLSACSSPIHHPQPLQVIESTLTFVSLLRIARVFLARRSRGWYFFPLYISRRLLRCFWFMTVRTRAMDLRTVLLKEVESWMWMVENCIWSWIRLRLECIWREIVGEG